MTETKGLTQYAKPLPDYGFVVPYVTKPGKPRAVLCDIDGTMMHMGDRRGFTEYDKVELDEPDMRVVALLGQLTSGFMAIEPIFVTGRPESCRAATERSISKVFARPRRLFMRPDTLPNGKPDYRPDYVVKYEIFDREIRDNYNVMAAIDDRLQVVHLWRALGILCLDVAGGDF